MGDAHASRREAATVVNRPATGAWASPEFVLDARCVGSARYYKCSVRRHGLIGPRRRSRLNRDLYGRGRGVGRDRGVGVVLGGRGIVANGVAVGVGVGPAAN